jgi:hypothetical protein
MIRNALALLSGLSALLFAPSCTRAPGESAGSAEDAEEGVVLSAATWSIAWDLDRVTLAAEGGFSVDTDLGYHVKVESGWLVDYSASFGPCNPAPATSTAAVFGLPIATAHAHPEEVDPSELLSLHVEDLAHPVDAELGAVSFPPVRYCRAHWLVARGKGVLDAPEGVDMLGRSVRLSGTWSRGTASGEIAIDTWWPQGRLVDLEEVVAPDALAEARQDGRTRFAFVTVRRPLGRAFDGIEFETATDAQVAGRLLDNLVGGTTLAVTLEAP